jgi:AraC family L-rhamnose operon transcriptional activator RhaR
VVCRVEHGQGEFTAGERRHRVGPGDLLFARPGVRHRIVGSEGLRLSRVAFDVTPGLAGDVANLVLQEFLAADNAVVKDPGAVGAVWDLLKEVARGPRTPGQKASLAALAPALLVSVVRAGGGDVPIRRAATSDGVGQARDGRDGDGLDWADGGDDNEPQPENGVEADEAPGQVPERHLRAVRLAVRYIQDNLDRPLRVEELARQVNVSPRQLTRLFATQLNEPPASYVERVRLERAAGLLARTRMPIKQIASELGYPDVPTFTRAFARQHKSPPGRFRRARQLNGDQE